MWSAHTALRAGFRCRAATWRAYAASSRRRVRGGFVRDRHLFRVRARDRRPGGALFESGAHERNRTADLLLTMQMLYRLSYVGVDDRCYPGRCGTIGGPAQMVCRTRKKRRGSAPGAGKTHSPGTTSPWRKSEEGLRKHRNLVTEPRCVNLKLLGKRQLRPEPALERAPGGINRRFEWGVGAGDGTRTRDIQLGRLALYQLSYSRSTLCIITRYGWWRGEDSNLRRHRRQIYSLFPLTAREPLHTNPTAELAKGLEPPTASLQMRCSTS